ncbi:MAG: M14-type cytosolic carboxypeptidase [Gemmataceae bacterium]
MPRRCLIVVFALVVALGPVYTADAPSTLVVKSDFPGGSAKVEKLDQGARRIEIVPAGRAEHGWVCWWYFKVEGITPGETLTLDVGNGVWATPDRAAFSLDNKTWQHTPPGKRSKGRITYEVKVPATEAWFAWGPRFVLSDARALLDGWAKRSPHAKVIELCKSKAGHSVPALVVEQEGAKPEDRLGIWVEARQHAWEAGSSWVCRGFTDWLLSDDPRAETLRKKARITIVPIMDVDNVERGEGGKNQQPHDHNRDWSAEPVWPEVRAAQEQIAAMDKQGRFDLFIDLHNPGAGDKQPFFFVSPPELLTPVRRRNVDSFIEAAKAEMRGPLALSPKTRPSGANYDKNWQKISKNWVSANTKEHVVAVCLETSWNTPNSIPENYQRVGKELGLAVERYTRENVRAK